MLYNFFSLKNIIQANLLNYNVSIKKNTHYNR
jgi:hypothetical protein